MLRRLPAQAVVVGKVWVLGLSIYGCNETSAADLDRAGASLVQPVAQHFAGINALQSLFALILVLALLLGCVWLLRKLNLSNGQVATSKMRIVGGIALGFREKVVLLQVGSKQLVLAVTPGRIETLTVLSGEECIDTQLKPAPPPSEINFADKLMQAIKRQTRE